MLVNFRLSQPAGSVLDEYWLIGIVLTLSTAAFYAKILKRVGKWRDFIEKFYANLSEKEGIGVNLLQEGGGTSGLWFGLFCILFVFCLLIVLISLIESNSAYLLFLGVLIIAGIFAFIVFLMVLKSFVTDRIVFFLQLIALSMSIASYGVVPVIVCGTATVFTSPMKDVQKVDKYTYKKYLNLMNTPTETQNENLKSLKQTSVNFKKLRQILLMKFLTLCFLILLLMGGLIASPFNFFMMMKQQGWDRFKSPHHHSSYYKALKHEKSFLILNIFIILLWLVISIANLSGLYFSLSIFERAILGVNYLFRSNITRLFFDNTKTTFIFVIWPIMSVNAVKLFHRITLLLYSLPMLLIFFIFLRKNLILLKKQNAKQKTMSNHYEKIKMQISEKIYEMCKSAGIHMPIIKVENSPYVDAKTMYLGFPIFRNVLVVSEGAWNHLKNLDNEFYCLLAHEMYHLKKHVFRQKLLCLISDFTLFGNGFLSLLQNFYKVEKEADNFAIKWLEQKETDAKNTLRDKNLILKLIEKKVINFDENIMNENQLRKRIENIGINDKRPILLAWQMSKNKKPIDAFKSLLELQEDVNTAEETKAEIKALHEIDEFSLADNFFSFANLGAGFYKKKVLREKGSTLNAKKLELNLRLLIKNDFYRKEFSRKYKESRMIIKLRINLKLLYQMYFGENIFTYFHPSVNQRIAWIKGEGT